MTFKVTSSTSIGIAGFARDTTATAIEKALELIGEGAQDVTITDPDGQVYEPDRFDELSLKYGGKNADRT